jgi:hypothetical protein
LIRGILPFSASALSALVLAGSLAYWSDPAQRWGRKDLMVPSRPIARDEVWLMPRSRFNIHPLRIQEILWAPKLGVAVFGSSRVFSVRTSNLIPERALLNLSVGHAQVDQNIQLWKRLKKAQKGPSTVLVGIDPWTFDARESARFRSTPIDPLDSVIKLAYDFKGLLEWTNVYYAARQFFFRIHPPLKVPSFVPERMIPTGRSAVRFDGSVIRPLPKSAYSWQEAAEEFKKAEPVQNPWRYDADEVALFRNWLMDMRSQGCHIYLLLPPFHPKLFSLYRQYHPEVLAQVQAIARGFVREMPDVQLCDRTDPGQADCQEDEYVDGLHAKPACVARIVSGCFAHLSN